MPVTNWAGNVVFTPSDVHRPTSIDELRRLVASCSKARVLGTGHSFNRIADTGGDLISIADLPCAVTLDEGAATATVSAGVTYGALATMLHQRGYALRNVASLPHISVAGACATGTHGSGDTNGTLSSAVTAVTLVTAGGDLVRLSRHNDGDRFAGSVVALGALGVVVELTLDVVPTFDVAQYVYDDVPLDVVAGAVDDVFSAAYSVSLFTGWRSGMGSLWFKHKVEPGVPTDVVRHLGEHPEVGGHPAGGARHPIPGADAVNCTEQLGRPGPWFDRLPHFRMGFTPSSGSEVQSEYLLPRERAPQAFAALLDRAGRIAPALQITEVRTVAADDLWLSPAYRRPTVAFHFTWVPDIEAVAAAVAAVEEALTPMGARPHWGKVFAMPPEAFPALYERLDAFVGLAHELDPGGTFRNAFLDRYLPR